MADEITLLEMLLARARQGAGVAHEAILETIAVGDVVQLRPGADHHWETSLLLVSRILPDGGVQGQIMRPHRGGCREAWYTYRPPSLARIGRMPFPEPAVRVRSWSYDGPPCPACGRPLRKPEKPEVVIRKPAKQGVKYADWLQEIIDRKPAIVDRKPAKQAGAPVRKPAQREKAQEAERRADQVVRERQAARERRGKDRVRRAKQA